MINKYTAAFVVSILLPFQSSANYGRYYEIPGYAISCKVDHNSKPYEYWFADSFGRVAVSRLGLPNGAQLFAYVVDGVKLENGFDLRLRTEVGKQYRISFNNGKGFIFDGIAKYDCKARKTTFVY